LHWARPQRKFQPHVFVRERGRERRHVVVVVVVVVVILMIGRLVGVVKVSNTMIHNDKENVKHGNCDAGGTFVHLGLSDS